MRAAVIGGAGFLGSHLVDYLISAGHSVVVMDNLCAGRRDFVSPQARLIQCDITFSEGALKETFVAYGITHVFNYAAHPYIPVSFQRPLHVFESTATGAIKVINAAHEAGCERILQVSSAELYGETLLADTQITESYAVAPHSTYGAAKAAVDYYCQCAWKERGVPVVALRQFNCVGERETHPYIVPEIISQLYKQKRNAVATVHLGNNSTRDFMYAGDAVRYAAELIDAGSPGEVYNLGSQAGIKIYDLARLIGSIMGFSKVTVDVDAARVRPWEIWHLQSCNDKIDARCKYRANTSLTGAISRAIAWHDASGGRWSWE